MPSRRANALWTRGPWGDAAREANRPYEFDQTGWGRGAGGSKVKGQHMEAPMTGAVEESSEPRRHFVQHVAGMRCGPDTDQLTPTQDFGRGHGEYRVVH